MLLTALRIIKGRVLSVLLVMWSKFRKIQIFPQRCCGKMEQWSKCDPAGRLLLMLSIVHASFLVFTEDHLEELCLAR